MVGHLGLKPCPLGLGMEVTSPDKVYWHKDCSVEVRGHISAVMYQG